MPDTFHTLSFISKTIALGQSLNSPCTEQEPVSGVGEAAQGAEIPACGTSDSKSHYTELPKHTPMSCLFFLFQEVEVKNGTDRRSRQSDEIWAKTSMTQPLSITSLQSAWDGTRAHMPA